MKYAATMVLILAQLAAGQRPAPLQNSGRLSGVYRATAPAASSEERERYFYLTFFPSGRVRRSRPDIGLRGYDDAYQMNFELRNGIPKEVRRWGTYRLQGEQGQIVFANRDVWNFDLKGYPQTIEAQGRTYALLDSGNGLRLQGTYKNEKEDSFITFMPNGQMNQQGVVPNCVGGGEHYGMNSHGIVGVTGSSTPFCVDKPLPGGYNLGNYTIELQFPGSSNSFAFWPEPGPNRATPAAVYIDNKKYVLVSGN